MNPSYAPLPDPAFQARQDEEHLRLLSLFYYVMAGIIGVTGLLFLFHIFMGLAIVGGTMGPTSGVAVAPNTFPGAPPTGFPTASPHPNTMPPSFGWLFVVMGAFALLASEVTAFLSFLAGRALAKREKKMLIQVVAGLLCLNVPLGTALGVFTFIVLGRPTVVPLFDSRPTS